MSATERTPVPQLQVGDRVQGYEYVWEVIKHEPPLNEGDTYVVTLKNVETGKELVRYLNSLQSYIVI